MNRLFVALFCLVLPSGVLATSTMSFVIDTSERFEMGKLDGVASLASGRLTDSFAMERTAVEGAPVALASIRGRDGAIYLGTGNEGAIYRVHGEGARLFADSDAAAITSLAFAGDTLYAGSLPKGQIFKVDATGKLRELAAPAGAEHIWALAHDRKRGLLYAATGPEGKLFAIDATGKVKLVYDDTAEHLLSLALDDEGRVLVGTSNGARLVRISGGEARVLHDFPGQELTALSTQGGIIAAAANEFGDPVPAPTAASNDPTARLKRPKPGKGKLFVIGERGRVDELYSSDSAHIASVEVDVAGRAVFAGLGQEGRIIRASLDGERALWSDVNERQVISLGLSTRTPYFVTSDGIAVYRIKANTQGGQWTSAVLDARFPSRWGELTFRARGAVRMQTRSGNTETPDATWSDWSKEHGAASPIQSPAGRFLQVRAKLGRDTELYGLTAYYLPDNQAARVRNVRVKPLSAKDDKGVNPANKPTTSPPSSIVTLTWDVENPDEDRLRFRLFYRGEEQQTFLPMLREHEILEHAQYAWDTRSVPDGHYRVRVVASDELVNPTSHARSTEALSAPVLVDNHAPQIPELTVVGRTLRGRIIDGVGPVTNIEVAIDGNPYVPVFPDDELLDTREERFRLDLGGLAQSTHIVSVRATDAAFNVASRAVEFTIHR